jgi:hypothetical protein
MKLYLVKNKDMLENEKEKYFACGSLADVVQTFPDATEIKYMGEVIVK